MHRRLWRENLDKLSAFGSQTTYAKLRFPAHMRQSLAQPNISTLGTLQPFLFARRLSHRSEARYQGAVAEKKACKTGSNRHAQSKKKKPSFVHNTFAELDHFAKTSVFIPIASAHTMIELHTMLRRLLSSAETSVRPDTKISITVTLSDNLTCQCLHCSTEGAYPQRKIDNGSL
jgi:hypothetical protein